MAKRHNDDFDEYRNKPNVTLEEYVEGCRKYPVFRRHLDLRPDETIENLIQSAVVFGVNEDALRGSLYLYDLTPDDDHIEEASLGLLEALVSRDKANKKHSDHAVGLGAAISYSTVNRLASKLVEACPTAPLPSLAILVDAALGLADSDRSSKAPRRPEPRRLAALLLAGNPRLSNRKIAAQVGVNQSTVRRWKKKPEFQELVKGVGTIKNVEALLK